MQNLEHAATVFLSVVAGLGEGCSAAALDERSPVCAGDPVRPGLLCFTHRQVISDGVCRCSAKFWACILQADVMPTAMWTTGMHACRGGPAAPRHHALCSAGHSAGGAAAAGRALHAAHIFWTASSGVPSKVLSASPKEAVMQVT
jgi:hypothetical protein